MYKADTLDNNQTPVWSNKYLGKYLKGKTMADKYVSPTGNDGNSGNDSDNPYLKISTAMTNVGDGDTIYLAPGTYDADNQSSATFYIYLGSKGKSFSFARDGDSGDVVIDGANTSYFLYIANADYNCTFNDITFDSSTDAPLRLLYTVASHTGGTITFNRCTVTSAKAHFRFIQALADPTTTRSFVFNDCTLDTATATTNYGILMDGFGSLEITDCIINYNGTASGSVLKLANPSGAITVSGCTINCTGPVCSLSDIGDLTFHNNTVTECTRFLSFTDIVTGDIIITNNTVTSTNNTTMLQLGVDDFGDVDEGEDFEYTDNYLTGIVVKNNTIIKDNENGHIVLIGSNCGTIDSGVAGTEGVEFAYNTLKSTNTVDDWSLVVKGNSNNIHNNVILGPNSIYLAGGSFNHIHHNSVRATVGYVLSWQDNRDQLQPEGNIVKHNIFDATDAAITIYDLEIEHLDNQFDYNCYVAGSTALASIGGTSCANLAALQARWATYSDTYPNNDANSIEADPLFVDVTFAGLDLSIETTSPCINAGGTDYSLSVAGETDFAGNARISNGAVDIGAYEIALNKTVFDAQITTRYPLDTISPVTRLTTTNGNSNATRTQWEFINEADLTTFTLIATAAGVDSANVTDADVSFVDIWLPPFTYYLVRFRQYDNGWGSWTSYQRIASRGIINSWERYQMLSSQSLSLY